MTLKLQEYLQYGWFHGYGRSEINLLDKNRPIGKTHANGVTSKFFGWTFSRTHDPESNTKWALFGNHRYHATRIKQQNEKRFHRVSM